MLSSEQYARFLEGTATPQDYMRFFRNQARACSFTKRYGRYTDYIRSGYPFPQGMTMCKRYPGMTRL